MIQKEFGYQEVSRLNGNPNPDRIGTSHVERSNLSARTALKRLSRITVAFSR